MFSSPRTPSCVYQLRGPVRWSAAVSAAARAPRARGPARYVGVASITLQLPWLPPLPRWGGGPGGVRRPRPAGAAAPGRCLPSRPVMRRGRAAAACALALRLGTARTATGRGRALGRVRGCPGTRTERRKQELATIPRYQRLNASGFAERKDTLAEGPTEPLTRVPYTCWVCGGEGNRVRAFICTLARAAPSPTPFSLACEW